MIILGLDPGLKTGYAIVCATPQTADIPRSAVRIMGYGIIPIIGEGRKAFVDSVRDWLERVEYDEAAFSEIVQMPKCPTSHAAIEVQGVIRAWGAVGYHPSTIHSQLGTANKADTRQFTKRVLGWQPQGEDHVSDAIAAALCHALKLGVWQPVIDLRRQPAEPIRRTRKAATMTDEQAIQAVREGRLPVKARR